MDLAAHERLIAKGILIIERPQDASGMQMEIKLILSFLAGGAWVTLSTLFAERYGTKIGGIVTGLPSTLLISLFFIGWTQTPDIAATSATIVPMMGAVNTVFLVIYIALIRINFCLAIAGSLLFWFTSSYALVVLKFSEFGLSIIIYALVVPFSYAFIEKVIRVVSKEGRASEITFGMVFIRVVFSGTIIVLAVLLGWQGGPLLGGMFAMFPAMFLGTLVITYFSHGPLFSSAVMKSALYGSISVVLYGVLVRYTYAPLGLWWGTLVCAFVSFFVAFCIHAFVVRLV